MRLRNVKGSRELIASNDFVIHDPESRKGKWKDLFQNNAPIHIEIGMGKGQFLLKMAEANPNVNFIGIEKYSSVLIRAIEKRNEMQLSNLMYIRMDAENIEMVFEKNEVDCIYLNFSDPWPKDRHAKRRLTSRNFLGKYDKFLQSEGTIFFKTDNRELFDFSLEEVKESDWNLLHYTYDLHNSIYKDGNIMTEYEEKFSGQGKPICFMEIKR